MKRFLLLASVLALTACNREQKYQTMVATGGGNVERGKQLITQYGCNSCHVIPGIQGAKGMVGPPLDHIASRQIIAGKLPNTPQNMMQWLQNPQSIDPQNAMPNLGVKPDEARDMTAYLVSLK
ncbi:MAG: cytochrome c family protein [Thermoanaerobaculia bacterium]